MSLSVNLQHDWLPLRKKKEFKSPTFPSNSTDWQDTSSESASDTKALFATYLDTCRENTRVRSERQQRWVCWPWCSGRIDPSCTSPAPLWTVDPTLLLKILLFNSNSALKIDFFFSPLKQDVIISLVLFENREGNINMSELLEWNPTQHGASTQHLVWTLVGLVL